MTATEAARKFDFPLSPKSPAFLIAADVALAASLALPGVWKDVGTRNAVLFALLGLAVWQGVLCWQCLGGKRPRPTVEPHFRSNHVLQMGFHWTILLYWGLYYRDVFHHLNEVGVQLAFGYALDATIAWTLRRNWYLGFAVVPIVLSTNFFIWFEHEYFSIQLALIAGALLSKTFITWTKTPDGRRSHVFNPTGLPLTVISVILLVTDHTQLGRGPDISESFQLGPNIFEVIFFVGLLVNLVFETVLLMGSAILTLVVIDCFLQHFLGCSILRLPFLPHVFFAATLLLPDPATTPRSNGGKILAGALYACCVNVSIAALHSIDLPGYYDKVLPIPLVNLLSPTLDRAGRRMSFGAMKALQALPGHVARLSRLHAVHLVSWAAFFVWYMPELKEGRFPLFPPPASVRKSAHMQDLTEGYHTFCRLRPKVCEPFGFIDELSYWRNGAPLHKFD